MPNPQLTRDKKLRHFLTTEGLPRAMLLDVLERIDDKRRRGLTPPCGTAPHRVVEAFYTPDGLSSAALELLVAAQEITLERASPLDLAADKPADVAGHARPGVLLLLRHAESGAAHAVAPFLSGTAGLVNVQDGEHAAGIDALQDLMTLRERVPQLHNAVIALAGDLVHSPRLRALVHALTTLGVPELRVRHLGPTLPAGLDALGVRGFEHDDPSVCAGVDAFLSCEYALSDAAVRACVFGALFDVMNAAMAHSPGGAAAGTSSDASNDAGVSP